MENRNQLKLIGEAIRQRRLTKGMSIKELAEKVAVSERTISRAENGETNLRITIFLKIRRVLDVRLDDLCKP